MCLLMRAASRPRPALRAGDRLLARAVSLDPVRTSTRGWCMQAPEFHGAGKGQRVAYLSSHSRGVEAVAAGRAAH